MELGDWKNPWISRSQPWNGRNGEISPSQIFPKIFQPGSGLSCPFTGPKTIPKFPLPSSSRNYQEFPGIIRNYQEWSGIITNFQEFPGILPPQPSHSSRPGPRLWGGSQTPQPSGPIPTKHPRKAREAGAAQPQQDLKDKNWNFCLLNFQFPSACTGIQPQKIGKGRIPKTGREFWLLPHPEIPEIQELTPCLHLLFALDLPQVWVTEFKQKEKKPTKNPNPLCFTSQISLGKENLGNNEGTSLFYPKKPLRMCSEH